MPATIPPRRQGLAVEILGFVLLAALHVALAAPMRAPMIFGDETANLGIARFLAGRPPFPLLAHPVQAWAPYYRFGYPLLVMPAWRLTDDPLTVYRAALVLNGILLAALFPLLAAFARRVLGLPRGDAALAAFAASLYPAFVLQSNLTWSESLVIPLVTGLFLAFYRLAARPGMGTACAFGLLSVFAYAVHERTLGLVPLALLAIAALWRRGRLSGRAAAVSCGAMLAGFAAVRAADAAIFARLWASSSRRYGVGDIAANLADPEVVGRIALSLTGQLWYLTVASLGLFPLGVWVLVRTARQGEAPERRLTALFVLAAAAVLIGTSSVFLLRLLRADIAVYGRYSEAFLAPFLVAGLAGLYGAARRYRLPAALGTVVLAGVLVEILLLGHPPEIWQRVYQQMNLLGIMPAVLLLGGLRLLWITALGTGAGIAVQAAGAFRPRAAAVLAGALFLTGAVWFHRSWTVPTNLMGYQARSIPDAVRALSAPEVSYDLAGATHDEYFSYQFRLGDTRMVLFDQRRERPPRELVIANKSFGDTGATGATGARLVFPERYIDQALWVLPGALQERLGREGRLFPADPGAPLPAEALRSELEWIEPPGEPLRLVPGRAHRLPLRVTHRGTGAPWLPFAAREDPRGAVRVAVRWLGGDGTVLLDERAELPRAVAPGESVEAEVSLLATLPPGRYTVRIGPVQELVGWFDAAGDGSLDLAVEVR